MRLGRRHGLGLGFHLLHHGRLGIVCGHAAEFFQGLDGFGVVRLEVLLLFVQGVQTLLELFLVLLELTLCVFVLVNGALEIRLRSLDALFSFVELAVKVFALVGLLLFEGDELLLGLENFLLFDGFSAQFGFANNAVCFACEHSEKQEVACASSQKESSGCGEDGGHGCQVVPWAQPSSAAWMRWRRSSTWSAGHVGAAPSFGTEEGDGSGEAERA